MGARGVACWAGLSADAVLAQFPHQAKVLRAISARYSSHDFIGNPNVLTWLLGRPPTTFEEYVRQQYATFTRSEANR